MYAFADSARSFIPLVICPWWGAVLEAAAVVAAAFPNPVAPAWLACPVAWLPPWAPVAVTAVAAADYSLGYDSPALCIVCWLALALY